jgi:hypothetical protein
MNHYMKIQLYNDASKFQYIRQSPILRYKCEHGILNRMVDSKTLTLPDDILQFNHLLPPRHGQINSWVDGITKLFEPMNVPTSSGQPYCNVCSAYQPSSTRQLKIDRLSDSLTLQLCRIPVRDPTLPQEKIVEICRKPMIISPVLDMSVYYHPEALKSLPGSSKYSHRVMSLKLALSTMADVLIDIIVGYLWKPAQYWLQSILLCGSVITNNNDKDDNDETSLIVRCLPTESETLNVCHLNDNKKTEWWQIDQHSVTPFSPTEIFATRPVAGSSTMPLTHAIALRYQLEQ